MKRLGQLALLGLALAAILVGKGASSDLVVLKTRDIEYQDFYTTLWAVDEHRWLWLRALSPDSEWLGQITPGMEVEIERNGETERFEANVIHDPRMRAKVDTWMREKYGLADRVREWVLGSSTVPVKLVPVDEF